MIVSLYIIIIVAVLLVLALVTPLFSPFYRKVLVEEVVKDENGDEGNGSKLPSVSIVLAEHDCAHRLEYVLPKYLSQNYNGDYQVVVVIDSTDSKSEDLLKRLVEQHSNLYYTKLPDSSRYVSRKKLGLTLGIRAAKYEWILTADVDCTPSSDNWLAAMASHCEDDKNMVLGMTMYDYDASSYYKFERLRTMLYYLRSAQRGMAFSTNQSVVMIRRSEFFEQRGFYGNLEFARAEMEFLVNKFAKEDACAIAIESDAWMMQSEPNDDLWQMQHLYAFDAMKGLKRAAKIKFMQRWDMFTMHLFNVLSFIAVVVGAVFTALQLGELQIPALQGIVPMQPYDAFILLGASVLLWIVSLIERCCIYSDMLGYFECVGSLHAVIMEWGLSFRRMCLRIRYKFADKNDFITHKL